MAYPHYTPPGAQPGTPTAIPGTPYSYAAYSAAAYGQPGTTAYGQQPGQPTAYAGYPPGSPYPTMAGWSPYPYGYMHPQQAQQYQSQPRPSYTPVTSTSSPAPTPAPQRVAASTYAPSQLRESSTAASINTRTTRAKQPSVKGLFNKELRNLMYGFGDDRNPAPDTVNVMEEILIEFITDVCQAGGSARKPRLTVEDLRRALSRPADAKKLARMEELLFMQEDIKRSRALFNDTDVPQGREY